MNQKQLHMQPVSSRYLEQYNALLRYVFQVTDQELSSVGWQEKEFIRAKFPTMEKADVIGWFDRDTLVSQVAVYPMQARIFGRTYAMGGLTGVGTYPEYSNLGLMHKLLEQALTNMRARQIEHQRRLYALPLKQALEKVCPFLVTHVIREAVIVFRQSLVTIHGSPLLFRPP